VNNVKVSSLDLEISFHGRYDSDESYHEHKTQYDRIMGIDLMKGKGTSLNFG
jgi:hypothetical protein